MSVQIMADVFKLPLYPGAKLVLLSLANYSNDRGFCWPSQAAIAEDATLSDRQVRTIIHTLESLGWLEIAAVGNGRGKNTQYILNLAQIRAKAADTSTISGLPGKAEKAEVWNTKAEVCDTKGGSPTPDDPSGSIKEPSVENIRPRKPKAPALIPLTDAERARLIADFPQVSEADEVIALALSHPAHLKYPTNQYGYVRNWLRDNAKRDAERNPSGRAKAPVENVGKSWEDVLAQRALLPPRRS